MREKTYIEDEINEIAGTLDEYEHKRVKLKRKPFIVLSSSSDSSNEDPSFMVIDSDDASAGGTPPKKSKNAPRTRGSRRVIDSSDDSDRENSNVASNLARLMKKKQIPRTSTKKSTADLDVSIHDLTIEVSTDDEHMLLQNNIRNEFLRDADLLAVNDETSCTTVKVQFSSHPERRFDIPDTARNAFSNIIRIVLQSYNIPEDRTNLYKMVQITPKSLDVVHISEPRCLQELIADGEFNEIYDTFQITENELAEGRKGDVKENIDPNMINLRIICQDATKSRSLVINRNATVKDVKEKLFDLDKDYFDAFYNIKTCLVNDTKYQVRQMNQSEQRKATQKNSKSAYR